MSGGGASTGLRRRDARHRWETQVGPSMTPMVDVTLVILIFFMASAAFIGPEVVLATGFDARDEAGRGGTLTLPDAIIEIRLEASADGGVRATGVGLERGTIDELGASLADLGAGVAGDDPLTVIIEAGEAVPYGSVVRVRDLCERSGLTRVVVR